ncbi:MAG: SOS response-associated peptidase [Ignavibacteriae bacterium]|nr:SOS response-associated peptidase [Ignavibacteriota bacterium]
MCFYTSLEKTADMLEEQFDATFEDRRIFFPFYVVSGFSFPRVPIITTESPRVIQSIPWGLIPFWCRDEKHAHEMRGYNLNARGETLFEKASFKHSIVRRRCLVLVSGFFEWHTYRKNKYPFYIRMKNHQPFALGGLYDHWTNKENGEIITSFAIITTEANELLSEIHNTKSRMPLILPQAKEREWIGAISKQEIETMIQPSDETLLEACSVSTLLSSRTQNPNTPDVQSPCEYPELTDTLYAKIKTRT